LVDRILDEIGRDAAVIATGGLSEVVAPLARTIEHIDLDLTLTGLRLLYQHYTRHD
jgi:type III pantothenate kinase